MLKSTLQSPVSLFCIGDCRRRVAPAHAGRVDERLPIPCTASGRLLVDRSQAVGAERAASNCNRLQASIECNCIQLLFWNVYWSSGWCFLQTKLKGINGNSIRCIWGQIWIKTSKKTHFELWILCMIIEERKSNSWQRPYRYSFISLSPHSSTQSGKDPSTPIFHILLIWKVQLKEKLSICFNQPAGNKIWVWNWSL